ncbi:MAG: two-component system sensor histidine kinase NtrB [Bacillota bacterium]|jgi:two-component system, sporulation sensor kinase E
MFSWIEILDQLPIGIIVADTQGIITCINTLTEELLGIRKDQVIGRDYGEIQCPMVFLDCTENLLDLLGDALNRGIFYDQVELSALINGNPSTLRISSRTIKEGEKCVGVLLFFTDCTIEKALEEQVERNECLRAVGQMAAGICHEIRNPLQSVKGFVQLLQEKDKFNQETCCYTEIMLSEINRINSIIKEYLQLARPSAVKLERKDIDLIVSEVTMLVNSQAILRNVVIEQDLTKKMPLIMMDESRIKQVLVNILANALAAIPDKGIIKIKTWYDYYYREAYISIADNGIGMDQKTMDKIGSPFFTTKEEGTGLGLAVSYRIVKEHGGRIQVESSLGKGTKFTIILPESAGLGEKIKNNVI